MVKFKVFVIVASTFATINSFSQGIGINPLGNTPDPSAGLDIDFSNKGLLIPRVALTSATDAATIPSPATSLLVYNTGTGGLSPAGYYYNAGTPGAPNWVKLFSGGSPGDAWLTTGNNGVSVSTHFLGTINNTGLAFRTNNIERMRLHNSGQLSIGDNAPGGKLDVHQESANDVARFVTYGSSNDIRLRRTQGSKSSPSATGVANTILGRIFAEGYDGSGFTAAAAIEMSTDNTGGSSTDMPGRITFYTTPDNSGSLTQRMVIKNNGNVGIGVTNPNDRLQVGYGNVRIGEVNPPNTGTFPAYGRFLYFSGGPAGGTWDSDNSDLLWMARYNSASDNSELRVHIGDNAQSQDAFVVGLTQSGNYQQILRVQGNFRVGINTNNPSTELHVHTSNGPTTLRISSNNASSHRGIQMGTTNGWYIGADGAENFVLNRDIPLGTGTTVFRVYSSTNPRMSHFLSRQSGVSGDGTSQDGPTNVIIEAGNGAGRYNDWPNGWGGGISTWDICGASTFMTGYGTRSDRKYKRNIQILPSDELLEKFMKIEPVQYYINQETLKTDDPDRLRFGFIANDIEKLFPNLVINAGMPGHVARGLEYDGFIPILVKVVQEQQKRIELLEQELKSLREGK